MCELTRPFAYFCPQLLLFVCEQMHCSVTPPSVSGKNANTSIRPLLRSLQNATVYTNLLSLPNSPADGFHDSLSPAKP